MLPLIAALGCGKSDEARLARLVPALPRSIVHHVIVSDDSAFAVYARDTGNRALRDAFGEMHIALAADSGRNFEEHSRILRRPMYRIARVLDSEYGLHEQHNLCQTLFEGPGEEARARMRLGIEFWSIRNDRNVSAEERLEALFDLLDRVVELGSPNLQLVVKSAISEVYRELGREKSAKSFLLDALNDARSLGARVMTCQLLGQLAGFYRTSGDTDSLRLCYDEALRLAERHRLPEQAARIAMFYASYHHSEGRLAVAAAYYNDAMRYCREFKAGRHELRVILWAMESHAELGCWEAVEALIERARVLEKKFARERRADPRAGRGEKSFYEVGVDVFEARLLMSRGEVSKAAGIFEDIDEYVKRYTARGARAAFLYRWAEGLADNGVHGDALRVAEQGQTFCRATYVEDWRLKFVNLSSRVLVESGRPLEALREADVFERGYESGNANIRGKLRMERVLSPVFRARAHIQLGDTTSALAALEEGLWRLEGCAAELQASVQGYLWLGRCTPLRGLLFDLCAGDPLMGYGAALYWQSLGSALGTGVGETAVTGTRVPSRLEKIKSIASKNIEKVGSLGATHIVCVTREREVWRWTASGGTVRHEVLDRSRQELEKLVQNCVAGMSAGPVEPDAAIPPALTQALRTLALDLLPDGIAGGSRLRGAGPVLVTVDGFLGRLPFGALNVGSGGAYVPLLGLFDVVYLRYSGEANDPAEEKREKGGDGLVFVVSRPSRYAMARFPLSGALPGTQVEGGLVAAAFSGARHFRGESATKANLVSNWEHASFVYFASHVYRDPEIPYVSLIPMGAAGGADPESAFLDVSDIRSAHLHECRVAVLSGCSSGAPSVMGWNSGPGLGDVFVDSGAGAAVMTFWDLRDRDENGLMVRVMNRWKREGLGAAAVFCEEQRRLISGQDGPRHPHNWATYFLTLGDFDNTLP